jgi:hypothetical protein
MKSNMFFLILPVTNETAINAQSDLTIFDTLSTFLHLPTTRILTDTLSLSLLTTKSSVLETFIVMFDIF